MSFSLIPDFYLSTYAEVDAAFLRDHKIRGILLDIDNTLEPYENPDPSPELLSWFEMLESEGVRFAFVSNNGKGRVERFNRDLGKVAFARAAKPFKKTLIKAMGEIRTEPSETIFMGDQVYTDVLAAHNAGIRAALVKPIRDRRDPLTFFKRLCEKPVLRAFEKRGGRQ